MVVYLSENYILLKILERFVQNQLQIQVPRMRATWDKTTFKISAAAGAASWNNLQAKFKVLNMTMAKTTSEEDIKEASIVWKLFRKSKHKKC